MSGRRTRADRLAADLEPIAAQLRDGEGTLYGCDVATENGGTVERGGIACEEGWLSLELEARQR
ncbi:hypothetical protein BRD06_02055 [Halobacteriales archaeon QS_9_67_15]|nr:MAG: hypothetical protein BRD06_02055 [Halobacteriales archaeon QS_9_67_15]